MDTEELRAAAGAGRYVLAGTMLTGGAVYPDSVVAVADGRIAYAGPREASAAADLDGAAELALPPGGKILPGLVDVHCHGAAGGDFSNGDPAAARAAADFMHRSGTTTLLASMVTASRDNLLATLGSLRPLADDGLIAGVHAEGPFLSHARCGAQDPHWLRNPDPELLRSLLRAAGQTLKTMTYASELPGAGQIVRILAEHGAVPSLGHTDADAEGAAASLTEASDLIAASPGGRFGAAARPTVTHLFNGMPALHHRAPGAAAACLRLARAGTVAVEIVGDGVHLDPETVRMVFALAGAENVALVTDAIAATGLPDGDYMLGHSAVSVRTGVARLHRNGALAGGTATLLEIVRRTIDAGVDPADAVRSATAVPAGILGLETELGSLQAGMRADVLAVDADFGLAHVIRGGELLDIRP